MIHTVSLKLNKEFKRVYSHGNSAVGSYLVVYALKNRRFAGTRLGITVSKTVGKAVVRNRIRRLIRECYRKYELNIKVGYDIVIVARKRAVDKSLSQIDKDLGYAMRKLSLLDE